MLQLIQRPMAQFVSALLLMACTSTTRAQNTSTNVPPIIDVHHHAMDNENGFSIGPMCPNTSKFTASDPKTDTGQRFGWVQEECSQNCIPQRKAST